MASTPPPPDRERARSRRTLVLVGILLTILLAGIDGTVVGTIMPIGVRDLGGEALYAWAFAAYMLATAVTLPAWGPGSDRWGRRRTFVAGVAVFVVGSLLCGLAPTMPLFIAARVVQGVGAGAVFSVPFIVLAVVYPPERRARALGVVASAWALASVAGPIVGTAIVSVASWRWVFLLNLPVGLLGTALVLRGMDESVGDRRGRFDVLGSVLVGLAGAAVITAFVALGEGRAGPIEAALIVAGLALAAAFVWVESRASSPVIPLGFFRKRGFSAGTAAGFLSSFTAFGLFAFLPLEVDHLFHGPRAVGLVVTAFSVSWSAAALASGRLVHRLGERAFALAGMTVVLLGLALLAPAVDHGTLSRVAGAAAVVGLGMGTMTPALTVSVQNAVEVQRMGAATAGLQFVRQLGSALGVGSFGLAVRVLGFPAAIWLLLAATALGLGASALLPTSSLAASAPPSVSPGE